MRTNEGGSGKAYVSALSAAKDGGVVTRWNSVALDPLVDGAYGHGIFRRVSIFREIGAAGPHSDNVANGDLCVHASR